MWTAPAQSRIVYRALRVWPATAPQSSWRQDVKMTSDEEAAGTSGTACSRRSTLIFDVSYQNAILRSCRGRDAFKRRRKRKCAFVTSYLLSYLKCAGAPSAFRTSPSEGVSEAEAEAVGLGAQEPQRDETERDRRHRRRISDNANDRNFQIQVRDCNGDEEQGEDGSERGQSRLDEMRVI